MSLTLLAPLAAHAQVLVDIESCVTQADPVARFGCYEALARQATGREPGTPAPVRQQDGAATAAAQAAAPAPREDRAANLPATATAGGAPATALPEVEDFGRDDQARARIEAGPDGAATLLDNVVTVEAFRPNQVTLTLASGQVWRQMLPRRFPLREGDAVRIYPTRWGKSYRLSSEGKPGFIQVERIDSGG